MNEAVNIPVILKSDKAGARLWVWLDEQFQNIEAVRPLATEICIISERLEEVRTKIGEQGLTVSAARGRTAKNGLLDVELKLSKQIAALWKGLGLADKPPEDAPVGSGRPVGRPSGLWQG